MRNPLPLSAVDSEHRERQVDFNQLKADTRFAATVAPECRKLGPSAVAVGEVQAPRGRSNAAANAVRYCIRFELTRFLESLGTVTDLDECLNPVVLSPGFTAEVATTRATIWHGDAVQRARTVAEDFSVGVHIKGTMAGLGTLFQSGRRA